MNVWIPVVGTETFFYRKEKNQTWLDTCLGVPECSVTAKQRKLLAQEDVTQHFTEGSDSSFSQVNLTFTHK